ncbi:MAG: ATP-binding protein [Ignavibacteria bacterium]|nr:ATP-binding protein [Ignavibacteria bacterium]
MKTFKELSLSKKILFGILPLFLLFVAVSVVIQNRFQEEVLMEEATVASITYANIIRESMVSMMINDLKVDTTFLHRLSGFAQFDTIKVFSNDLRLRQEIVERESVHVIPHSGSLDPTVLSVMNGVSPLFMRTGQSFRAVVPFTATQVCQRCHAVPIDYTLGVADLYISFDRFDSAASGNWTRSVIIFLVFCIVAVTVASLLLSRFVTRPVDRLVDATTHVARELFGGPEPDPLHSGGRIGSNDELGVLAFRFEQMKATLRGKIIEINEARRMLSIRNQEVEKALRQLRRAQAELVRNERLAVAGRMTAQLSHEINNPIHNIQSLLESSLRKLEGESEIHQLVSVAQEEVGRMAKLTRQMLDFSRGNDHEVNPEPFQVSRMLNDLMMAYKDQLDQRGIGFAVTIANNLPEVIGSADRIKQVVINLILNAADAITPPGSITLNARRGKTGIEIRVSDTGSGIPEEYLGRIFDAFFTTKKEVSGVGLGLFVSYGIIRQHGGTIGVETAKGKGTTFTVILPVGQRQQETEGRIQ